MIQINDIATPTIKKIDGYFNDGRLALIRSSTSKVFCSVIKIVALTSLAIWAFPRQIDLPYMYSIMLGIALNLFEMTVGAGLIVEAKNLQSTLALAEWMEHCRQQPISGVENYNTIQSRVSQTYDFMNMIQQGENQTTDKLGGLLQSIYASRTCWIQKLNVMCKILGVVFIVIMIQNLISHQASVPTKIVCLVCLTLQIISKIHLIIGIIIVMFLFPLIFLAICGCCLFSCCCPERIRAMLPNSRLLHDQADHSFNIQEHPELQPIQFSATTLLQTDSECKICFQKFQFGDKLLILPCSNQHVFHQFCITVWFKASETCPLCRRSLNQMVAARVH